MERSRDLRLDLDGKKLRSFTGLRRKDVLKILDWTGLRRQEVEILDWTNEGRRT